MSTIGPITGKFRKVLIRDLVGSISLGLATAYGFWHFHHIPKFQYYDRVMQTLQSEIEAENAAWRAQTFAANSPEQAGSDE